MDIGESCLFAQYFWPLVEGWSHGKPMLCMSSVALRAPRPHRHKKQGLVAKARSIAVIKRGISLHKNLGARCHSGVP